MPTSISTRIHQNLAVVFVIALVSYGATFVLAQDLPVSPSYKVPPARNGGIYEFRNHQPIEPAPSSPTAKQVEDEVRALLRQADELDRTFEDREGKDPRRR